MNAITKQTGTTSYKATRNHAVKKNPQRGEWSIQFDETAHGPHVRCPFCVHGWMQESILLGGHILRECLSHSHRESLHSAQVRFAAGLETLLIITSKP